MCWARRASEQLYDEKDELYDIGVGQDARQAVLLLEIEAKDTTEVRYLRADRPRDDFAGVSAARKEAPLLRGPSRGAVLHPHEQGRARTSQS